MIKIKKNDSIIDIIQKIQKEKKDEIILDFPFGHPILHNYLSLKILKNKAGSKTLTIITSDLSSRKIGKRLGINYSIISDDKFIEHSQNSQLISHNMGFWEYLCFEIKSYIKLFYQFFVKNSKIDEFKKNSLKYYNKSGAGIFLLILFISLFVFFIVVFFVINKTYIKVKPEINVKTIAYNFIFRDFGDADNNVIDDRIIKLRKVSKIINLEENFQTTGINIGTGGKKSQGKIILYNTFLEDISLKSLTRVESKDGLIFEIPYQIKIPAGSQDSNGKIIPGILKVDVRAKDYDINGKYIGSRGNKIKIKEKFSLPGLKGDDKDKIYGEAIDSFTGGNDVFEKVLGEEDIENSKALFENILKKEALNQMKAYIEQENNVNNAKYDLLSYDDIFKNSKINIEIPKNLKVGDKIKSFKLNGNIDFSSYVYNKSSVINKLESIVNSRIIKEEKLVDGNIILEEGEKFIGVDEKSLRATNTLYEKSSPRFEIKLTMEIEAHLYKNFLNQNSAYVYRLKNLIYGLNEKDAEKILLNDKNIRSVDIDIQPFFMNKVSNIENNVIFEVEEP